MKKRLYFILFLLIFMIFCSCSNKTKGIVKIIEKDCFSIMENDLIKEEEFIIQRKEYIASFEKDLKEEKNLSIVAAGDLMFHMPVVNSAYNGKKYDFKYIFEDIKPLIESADIAIGNLETTIYPKRKLSGYPRFNSPIEILEGIKYAGFDVLTTANNHCADSGREGIISTVNNIKKSGMIPVGTGNIKDGKCAIIKRNGIKVGILSYTFSTNGIKVPKGMVNLIDKNIKKDIDLLKKKSDYIIVCIHIGTEYVMDAEPNVKKLFNEIAVMGADCILGSHPHVPRTAEIKEMNGRKVFIAYSLGNLLSSQNKPYTDIGLICKLRIKKDDKGEVSLISSDIIPVYRKIYIENGKNLYKIIDCSSNKKIDNLIDEEKEYIKNTYYDIINKSSIEVFN